jgi:hypothetical protein
MASRTAMRDCECEPKAGRNIEVPMEATELRVDGNKKVFPLIFFEGLEHEIVIIHRIDVVSSTKTTILSMTVKDKEKESKYKISCSKQYAKEGQFNFYGAPQNLKVYLVKLFWKAESYVLTQ